MVAVGESKQIQQIRFFLGSLCLVAAWLFPFAAGPSRDAMPQLFALGTLSAASLIFGMRAIPYRAMVALALSLLLLWMAPTAYWSGKLAGLTGLLLAGLACHVGGHMRRNTEGLAWVLSAILIAALINACEGLLQWFGLVSDLWPWVVEPDRRGIAYGAFRQRNLFASYLCVGTVCAIWLTHKRRITEAMAWFIVLILVFAVAASGSRTGAVELLACALLGLLWRKNQSAAVSRLMLGPLFFYGLATVLLPIAAKWHGFGFTTSVARASQAGQDSRLVLWSNALDLIQARPWFGWGWLESGYGHYATDSDLRFNELVSHFHNLPLQIAVEFGLPLALTVVGLIGWGAYKTWPRWTTKNRQTTDEKSDKDSQFAWLILLLVVGIHSMLELPLWYFGFLYLSGFSIGYLISPINDEDHSLLRRCSPTLRNGFAALLMALSLLGWTQYSQILGIQKAPFNNRPAQRDAVNAAQGAWLFQPNLDFASLGLTEVTPKNAREVRDKAEKLLHYSAEPNVIQPLLASLWLLQDIDSFRYHAKRYCRVSPDAFERWAQNAREPELQEQIRLVSEDCVLQDGGQH
jgi:O-antigen polymerase